MYISIQTFTINTYIILIFLDTYGVARWFSIKGVTFGVRSVSIFLSYVILANEFDDSIIRADDEATALQEDIKNKIK